MQNNVALDDMNGESSSVSMAPEMDSEPRAVRQYSVTQWALDLSLLLIAIAVFIQLEFNTKSHELGFFCDDQTIKLPYKHSIIPTSALIVGLVIVAAIVITTVECCHYYVWSSEQFKGNVVYRFADRFSIHPLFVHIYAYYGLALYGAFLSEVVVDFGKITIGRLRPHFLDVCRPTNETLSLCVADPRAYVPPELVNCTQTEHMKYWDSRMSFPSGHSAVAFYGAALMMFYLHDRGGLNKLRSIGVELVVHTLLIITASYVSYTRYIDHHHHPFDLIIGAIVGVFFAILVAYFSGLMFYQDRYEDDNSLETKQQTKKTTRTPLNSNIRLQNYGTLSSDETHLNGNSHQKHDVIENA